MKQLIGLVLASTMVLFAYCLIFDPFKQAPRYSCLTAKDIKEFYDYQARVRDTVNMMALEFHKKYDKKEKRKIETNIGIVVIIEDSYGNIKALKESKDSRKSDSILFERYWVVDTIKTP